MAYSLHNTVAATFAAIISAAVFVGASVAPAAANISSFVA